MPVDVTLHWYIVFKAVVKPTNNLLDGEIRIVAEQLNAY